MDIPDAFINIAIGMVGGIVGGVVTGIYTLKATDKAIRDASEKEQRRDEKEVQNLLTALGVEVKTLWDFHMKRVGEKVESLPAGQPLEFYYPLTQDYFTIYNSNAALIGRIRDVGLSEAIVVCYNKCKKVVDGFKYNNDLFRDYRDLRNQPNTSTTRAGERADAKYKEMADYAHIIREDHFELKGYVERLLSLLSKR